MIAILRRPPQLYGQLPISNGEVNTLQNPHCVPFVHFVEFVWGKFSGSRREPVSLEEPERPSAARATQEVRDLLERTSGPPRLRLENKALGGAKSIEMPEVALRLLADILKEMAAGNAVTVVPYQAELTTQQAAEYLNVSRPYVAKLLETDQIPFRSVGPRRRILFSDLVAYKHRDDTRRRKVADELTRQAEELGMGYDVSR